jgi:predicted glutamine amidotransferase
MCIILYKPSGRHLNKEHLKIAFQNNPHGYGFMWVENGHLNIIKGIAKDFTEIWGLTKHLSEFAYTMHLRWRTTGPISMEQCHPFQILDKKHDGLGFGVVHNGTLFELQHHPDKSDTQIFSEIFRDEILEKDPEFNLNYIHKIADNIDINNKMVFMTSDNRIFFVNKHLGKTIDGIWYSNTYSLLNGYRRKIMKPKLSNSY